MQKDSSKSTLGDYDRLPPEQMRLAHALDPEKGFVCGPRSVFEYWWNGSTGILTALAG